MNTSVDTGRGGSILRLVTARRTARSSLSRDGIDIDALRPLLTKKSQREACCQFMVLICFMVGFIFLLWLHEDIGNVFDLEHVLQIEMDKAFGEHSNTFDDINDVHEIWEFVDKSFLPTIIQHKDQRGHYLPHNEWGFLAYYNRVIGGVRFVQERSQEKRCPFKRLHEFYGKCQPLHTHDYHSYGYSPCNTTRSNNVTNNTEICYHKEEYVGKVDFHHDEGFTIDDKSKKFEFWVDILDDEETILKRINYLKDRHWLDRQTQYLMIEYITYNGQVEPLISVVKLVFDFTRVGYVEPITLIETIPLSPYFQLAWLKILLEVLFLVNLTYFTFIEFQEMYDYYKLLTLKRKTILNVIKHHYFSQEAGYGNLFDLINISINIFLTLIWISFIFHIKKVEHNLQHLHRPDESIDISYDDQDADVWSLYHHEIADIETSIELAVNDMKLVRSISVFVIFSMIFQMFKIWEGIPSLQGVSDTIVIAGKGLASFSIVLACLITVFAGSALLAFGQQLEEFHHIQIAIITTLIIMTKGEPEVYYKQYEIDPVFASVWHWLLICIMFMVCLNLILCILVDAYGEAHNAHSEGNRLTMPTLWQQGCDTFHYYFQKGWISAKRRSSALFNSAQSSRSNTSRNISKNKIDPEVDTFEIPNKKSTLMSSSARTKVQHHPTHDHSDFHQHQRSYAASLSSRSSFDSLDSEVLSSNSSNQNSVRFGLTEF